MLCTLIRMCWNRTDLTRSLKEYCRLRLYLGQYDISFVLTVLLFTYTLSACLLFISCCRYSFVLSLLSHAQGLGKYAYKSSTFSIVILKVTCIFFYSLGVIFVVMLPHIFALPWIPLGMTSRQLIVVCAGLAGYYPIHPRSYMNAWRARATELQQEQASNEDQQQMVEQ